MNPAFSVIFFTVLSGAGYGLLAWLGMLLFLFPSNVLSDDPQEMRVLLLLMLVPLMAGIALTAIGLVSSTFHLGKPERAWRAFSQWRTSWLSREGVLAMCTYVPAMALFVLLVAAYGGLGVEYALLQGLSHWLGAALCVMSLLTVACTAMIYASLKPIPAWRHRLVVPCYLVFSMLTGLTLLSAMLVTVRAMAGSDGPYFVVPVGVLVVPTGLILMMAAIKLTYWRAIDRNEMPSRESATALEGIGKVTVFERPHTEANYLTSEMGFVLARKHSRKLRAIALLLFAGLPLLMFALAWLLPAVAAIALWLAALSALLGAFVERWLFFAEAKHMVMLYY